ncbi:MAG TPA: response regulator [Oscillatoriaceae cyanobacterium]
MAHLLIVEDEPTNAELTAFICRRAGHSVRLAPNGLRALELLAAEKFDLAIVDVLMPVMDGLTLTHAVRMNARTADLPIVGLTALAGRDDLAALKQAGMTAVVAKPCRPEVILEAIAAALV